MGRRYEAGPDFYCWSLEKCEEEIVIAALGEISGLIQSGQKWQRTLECHFFELGKGFADECLNEMNGARERHGLEPILIRETAVGDYVRNRDEAMKSGRRRRACEELSQASPQVLAERLAQAKAEEKRLLAPHYTYEEFKLRKLQQNAAAPLRQDKVAKRASVCGVADVPRVIPIGIGMHPISEKHANFRRLATARTDRVLGDIRKLRESRVVKLRVQRGRGGENFRYHPGLSRQGTGHLSPQADEAIPLHSLKE